MNRLLSFIFVVGIVGLGGAMPAMAQYLPPTANLLLRYDIDQNGIVSRAEMNSGVNADYALADCLLQGNLALCPSNVFEEEVDAELLTGGAPVAPTDDEEQTDPDVVEEDDDDEEDEPDVELDATPQGTIALAYRNRNGNVWGQLGTTWFENVAFHDGKSWIVWETN